MPRRRNRHGPWVGSDCGCRGDPSPALPGLGAFGQVRSERRTWFTARVAVAGVSGPGGAAAGELTEGAGGLENCRRGC